MKKVVFCLLACALFLVGTFDVYAADKYLLKVNTEGLGQIKIVAEDEEVEFSDDYPTQSAFENTEAGTKFKVGAKADDGWKFVKWTLDGSDYSEEEILTIEVDKDMELIAVFESENDDDSEFITDSAVEDEEVTSTNNNKNVLIYVGIGAAVVLLLSSVVIVLKKKH